jgi:purine-nucleoside phosphorylase
MKNVSETKNRCRIQFEPVRLIFYPVSPTFAVQFQGMITKIYEAVKYIQSYYMHQPTVGVVLGSGLGSFQTNMNVEQEIDYNDIPHFPVNTVEGHEGKLIFGELNGRKIVAMSGRFHYYEGYTNKEVVFPIRVMKFLGIKTLLISNAAGGLNHLHQIGDLMFINDHISLFSENPLVGINDENIGPRFPDMSEPYKSELIEKALDIAAKNNITAHQGVYAGVTGPTFETRAEYRMLGLLGADAVGMSTVAETIAAAHMGIDVFGVSVITDLGHPDNISKITHEEVLKAARESEPKLACIFSALIAQL